MPFIQIYPTKDKIQDTDNNIDDLLLINYIKNSFDTIVNYLLEDKANIYKEIRENKRQEYESVLIKYEADIREHIKIEHQMKLYIDSLEVEKEELKYKNKLKKTKIEQLSQKLNTIKNIEEDQSLIIIRQEETSIMNSSQDTKTENESVSQYGKFRRFEEEILELRKEVQNYKEQNKNLSNNIKKLKEENTKKINEIKLLENKYKKDNKILKKQLLMAENKIKKLVELASNAKIENKKNQSNKNIFKSNKNNNKNNNSIQILNDIESNNSIHKISSKEKEDLSFVLNKTIRLRKNNATSLSATSSIDRIEKYLKRKYSTLKAQKTQKTCSILKLKKKEKNNSMLSKKKAEDLMKLFLNDSNHQNFTERIRCNRSIQKSDDNTAYYNQYCNRMKIKNDKKNVFKETITSNAIKKKKTNLTKKTSIKNNIFEMINNINNINIFPSNLKQNNHNSYYKSNNSNSSFNNNYKNDILKQYNNNTLNMNLKKNK